MIVILADLVWVWLALSVTITCAVYVPADEYVWLGFAVWLVLPSPKVQLYVYGGNPPPTMVWKFTVSGAVPELGVPVADT